MPHPNIMSIAYSSRYHRSAMPTSILRKIFTFILLVYSINLLGRLITMDKQFLDGTLDTSASTEAAIIFLVYLSLLLLVSLLTLIVGWSFKWLRYLILLIIIITIGFILAPQAWFDTLPPAFKAIGLAQQTALQFFELISRKFF